MPIDATSQTGAAPDLAERLLDAALTHVPFDGWSEAALRAACLDTETEMALARALYPRGGLDLALAYHRRGDAELARLLAAEDLRGLKIRERVALAVRRRLELADREAVRRGMVLLSLPLNAPEGARALWQTADTIWNALGDTSEDGNWYSKRALLSGVYSSTVLYWLGDQSAGDEASWAFLDRRIEDVMRFEKAKAQVQDSPVLSKLFALPLGIFASLRKPQGGAACAGGLPGSTGHGAR